MAMGNISGASTAMATKAQMVGFVPRDSIKEVKKQEEQTNTIRELEQQDTSNSGAKSGKDPRGPQGQAQAQVQTPDQKVRQRQISTPQQHSAPATEEQTEAKGAQQSQEQAPEAGRQAPRGQVAFDTSAQIQWRFNRAQTEQTNGSGGAQSQPEMQKRQFLKNLQSMVKNEYQQFVKSDDSLYSRRNLREIMSALNQDDPYSKKLSRDTDSRFAENEPAGELEGYNKFNAMRATRSLQVVLSHQQEQQESALQLVA